MFRYVPFLRVGGGCEAVHVKSINILDDCPPASMIPLWHQVCAKVLPSVMPCLIDPGSESVREAAFSCVETYLGRLKEVSARMKVEEEERRKAEVCREEEGGGAVKPSKEGV